MKIILKDIVTNMDFFKTVPNRYRFLICSDIDGISAGRIAERFIPEGIIYIYYNYIICNVYIYIYMNNLYYIEPEFDCVLLTGPFTTKEFTTEEDKAVNEGNCLYK